jgi:hypothetical protein
MTTVTYADILFQLVQIPFDVLSSVWRALNGPTHVNTRKPKVLRLGLLTIALRTESPLLMDCTDLARLFKSVETLPMVCIISSTRVSVGEATARVRKATRRRRR